MTCKLIFKVSKYTANSPITENEKDIKYHKKTGIPEKQFYLC